MGLIKIFMDVPALSLFDDEILFWLSEAEQVKKPADLADLAVVYCDRNDMQKARKLIGRVRKELAHERDQGEKKELALACFRHCEQAEQAFALMFKHKKLHEKRCTWTIVR